MELIEKLLVIAGMAIGFLGIVLSVILIKINRKKAIWAIIISCVYIALMLYYLYLAFYTTKECSCICPPAPEGTQLNVAPKAAPEPEVSKSSTEQVAFESTASNSSLTPNDDLAVDKTSIIKVTGALKNGQPQEGVKVNVVGFLPKAKRIHNDGNKIGFPFTYKDMISKFAVDDNKSVFRVEIIETKTKDILGTLYIKFNP